VSQKISLRFSSIFSQTVGNFSSKTLHAYYTFLATLEYFGEVMSD